jgi:hypothetical protein
MSDVVDDEVLIVLVDVEEHWFADVSKWRPTPRTQFGL